ncbi:MAG: hypothetical protein IPN51_11810 [Chloracidobacterium sp.]|nr:hypothetical protein [Chloracidobacterium sp.]
MRKTLIATVLIVATAICVGAQTNAGTIKKDAAEKFAAETLEFLRETSADVGNMRSVENRITFNAELASLMWFRDEKEAKAMYAAVIGDFRQLLIDYDQMLNSPDMSMVDEDAPGGFLTGRGGLLPVERKFRVAMAVRQQISMSLAEHEPELAYSFYADSLDLITDPSRRKQQESSDKYFEFQLITQIAASNATKALKFATASLKEGFEYQHIDLLRKIYAKDADNGIEFGAAILSKIKTDRSKIKSGYLYSSLLTFGAENLEASKKTGGKKAVYSQNDLRDIADQFGQMVLDGNNEDALPTSWADQIGKFSPSRAAQIRSKFPGTKAVLKMGANTAVNAAGLGSAGAIDSDVNSNTADPDREARDLRAKAEKEAMDKVNGLLTKPLPDEERAKIVAEARKIISQTPGKERKLLGLSLLAAQVARLGDKELAAEIMRDAERLVNPQPKNYRDFMFSLMLVSGFAEADPDKAFTLLDDVISRTNDTLAAFVKVAEFIDTADELVDNGEVQVGAFGGSMITGLTKELGVANGTINSLVKADFAKTRALTNRFDRIEIRVLAKMMVLRAILDDRRPDDSEVKAEAVSVPVTAVPMPQN